MRGISSKGFSLFELFDVITVHIQLDLLGHCRHLVAQYGCCLFLFFSSVLLGGKSCSFSSSIRQFHVRGTHSLLDIIDDVYHYYYYHHYV